MKKISALSVLVIFFSISVSAQQAPQARMQRQRIETRLHHHPGKLNNPRIMQYHRPMPQDRMMRQRALHRGMNPAQAHRLHKMQMRRKMVMHQFYMRRRVI